MIKRLCLMIPSLQAGGMERVMSELATYFCSNELLEVHLILFGPTGEIFFKIPGNLLVHKPKLGYNKKYRLFYGLHRMQFIRRKVNEIKPDSILSFGEIWNSFVLISLLGLRYSIYISDRCSPERKYNKLQTILRRLLYPNVTGIIAQTNQAKEIYSKQFKNKNIAVIGNPIRKIHCVTKVTRENIVLMVGRLIRSKNQDKLIELFLKINKPEWKLIIVGYDHLNQKNSHVLESMIKQNKAEDRIKIEGKQANVDSYYLRSKIFAFTSSSEGFPNAIGEAMSAGLPVVAFDCTAGPSDMIKDEYTGYLVPLNDYELFEKKLEILMNNEAKCEEFGLNGRNYINRFSISVIGNEYMNFIFPNMTLSHHFN